MPYVQQVLPADGRPIVAVSDWLKAWPDMVARWLPDYYLSLGTDGFGRSDTREALRALFEIDAPNIAAAALVAMARCGDLPAGKAAEAIRELGIDPDKLDPRRAASSGRRAATRPEVRGARRPHWRG